MNAEEVEALACLRLAAEWTRSKAIIESDCSMVQLVVQVWIHHRLLLL